MTDRKLVFITIVSLFPLMFYNYPFLTANTERHSVFFVTARITTYSASCELSQPMGLTEFSSSAKTRTSESRLYMYFKIMHVCLSA